MRPGGAAASAVRGVWRHAVGGQAARAGAVAAEFAVRQRARARTRALGGPRGAPALLGLHLCWKPFTAGDEVAQSPSLTRPSALAPLPLRLPLGRAPADGAVRWTLQTDYLPTRAGECVCMVCDGLFTWGLAAWGGQAAHAGWVALRGRPSGQPGPASVMSGVTCQGFRMSALGPIHLPSVAIHAIPNKGWAFAVQK